MIETASNFQSRLEELKAEQTARLTDVAAFRKQVAVAQRRLDKAQAEDKQLERAFRKEFSEAGDNLDHLLTLFKRRDEPQAHRTLHPHHAHTGSMAQQCAAGATASVGTSATAAGATTLTATATAGAGQTLPSSSSGEGPALTGSVTATRQVERQSSRLQQAGGNSKRSSRATSANDRKDAATAAVDGDSKDVKDANAAAERSSRRNSRGSSAGLDRLDLKQSSGETSSATAGADSKQATRIQDITEEDGQSFNPFSEHDALAAKAAAAPAVPRLEPLTILDLPTTGTSISHALFAKLQEWRQTKFARELEAKSAATALGELQAHLTALERDSEAVQDKMKALLARKVAFEEERGGLALNTELMLRLQQGLVEIEHAPVATDLGDCLMIERGAVHELNREVRAAAADNIATMVDVRGERRSIAVKEWCARLTPLGSSITSTGSGR